MILDTRKTTPRAARAREGRGRAPAAGQNHRMGLYDAILIKENHVALAGGLRGGGRRRPQRPPGHAGRGRVPRSGGGRRRRSPPAPTACCSTTWTSTGCAPRSPPGTPAGTSPVTLEASGGVDLDTVGAISATGVDFISVGALTHSAPPLDLSMLLEA